MLKYHKGDLMGMLSFKFNVQLIMVVVIGSHVGSVHDGSSYCKYRLRDFLWSCHYSGPFTALY